MKKTVCLMVLLCLCTVFLAGCGEVKVPDAIEAPTAAVTKEGEVSVWLLGDFDKGYYSLSELTEMAVNEAVRFSAARQQETAAVVEKVETMQGGKVMVSYKFDNCDSCSEFLGGVFFFGTVSEAIERGFSMDVIMRSVGDNSLFTEAQLRQAADNFLLITDMSVNIYCPRKVTHISNGALVNGDGSIDPSMTEGMVYILMK